MGYPDNIERKKMCAIVQSNYIPWKGYFDMIGMVDEFILFDDVQYTRRDWRNRNWIKTPEGIQWLTIPVNVKGRYDQLIKDTKVSDANWNKRHWETIKRAYTKARFFHDFMSFFEELYLDCRETYLSEINALFLRAICNILNITTKITKSSDYDLIQGKSERLAYLCFQAGATIYLSGPTAKTYMDEDLFVREGIMVQYMDYAGYPEYHQLYPPFEHSVSIIDLILNAGPDARKFMKSF
jgi:hypothetical protein